MRFVQNRTLAAWWDFTPETIGAWSSQGKLDRHFISGTLHHSEAAVNAYLIEVNQGMPAPPTFEDFLKRGVRLVNTATAAQLLGIQHVSVQSKIQRRRIHGLRFGGEWRFSTDMLDHYITRRKGYYTARMITELFGCSNRIIREFIRSELLEPIRVEGAGNFKHFFLPMQVYNCLLLHMPDWCKHQAKAWMHDFEASQRPALTTRQARRALGAGSTEFKMLVANRRLVYITLSLERRFSPASVHELFLQQEPLEMAEIGHIFGGTSYDVTAWLEQGLLICPLHNHLKLEYRRACLVAMLEPRLSPALKARNWLMGRQQSTSRPLISAPAVAKRYGVATHDIVLAAESGFLGGLQRPDGEWMFSDVRLRMSRATLQGWLAAQNQ